MLMCLVFSSVVASLQVRHAQAVDCKANPMLPSCGGFQLSSPTVLLLFHSPQCSSQVGINATVGERVYSARQIYSTSNEAELCMSFSASLPDSPKSFKWKCESGGQQMSQIPFASEDCSGKELGEMKGSHKLTYDSGMWSTLLNGRMCLTGSQSGLTSATIRSFRFNSSVDASARPLCVQSFLTMEGEVTSLTSDEEYAEFKLQQEEKARLQDAALGRRDKALFFGLGAAAGSLGGAAIAVLCIHCGICRRKSHGSAGEAILGGEGCVDARELSCSMLTIRSGEAGAFSELAG